MREIIADVERIAYCGLYCGACKRFVQEKCGGCKTNERASWCKVRSCCIEKHLTSCAGCEEFNDPSQCKKFNNVFSKLFGFIFGSDRAACIDCIKRAGTEAYAKKMTELGIPSFKRI